MGGGGVGGGGGFRGGGLGEGVCKIKEGWAGT